YWVRYSLKQIKNLHEFLPVKIRKHLTIHHKGYGNDSGNEGSLWDLITNLKVILFIHNVYIIPYLRILKVKRILFPFQKVHLLKYLDIYEKYCFKTPKTTYLKYF
ncbi:hypothetical protein CON79_28670, partial [Bacillus pseudomycoides]